MNEFMAALMGGAAGHVGGKAMERAIRKYGLVVAIAALAGVWFAHHHVTRSAAPATGLML